MVSSALDRSHGVLAGLALGDALGMPTQSLSRARIAQRFGRLTDLVDAPPDQPIAPGMGRGRVTDDTEQAVLLARELIEGAGHVDAARWSGALDAWERSMVARRSRDLLGPSTRRAIERIRAGEDPAEAGSSGTTNGAAMRVAPIGLLVSWAKGVHAVVDRVEEACLPTHHTGTAIAGAAAVACAVAAAVDGHPLDTVLDAALDGARLGERRGTGVPGPSVAARLEWVRHEASRRTGDDLDAWLYDVVGTTVATAESVPAAFALLPAAVADPADGLCRAARLGGDTDTIAAMLGAMTGAVVGRSGLPDVWCTTVEVVNDLHLRQLTADLLDLREVAL
ncbi:ADP-ribosylglycohydrolase family protein [Luteipulveratus halotolerans]|uniref:ADP-ribosylglycohydrolase family protein n=1 Tax=Luteipulveratus halotolerans TaxID=1631356 RepID=UPI000AA4DA1A|nr:ADP-ribosylglycohydrolase family protein [Luteipulveratus halotolerans]